MGRLIQQEDFGQRGAVRVMRYEITFADAAAGAGTYTFDLPTLPAGTIVRSWHAHVSAVFNSGTSDGLEFGDDADPNRFADSVDMQTLSNAAPAAGAAPDPAPHQLAADTVPRLTLTTVGAAPTTGKVQCSLTYELCNDA